MNWPWKKKEEVEDEIVYNTLKIVFERYPIKVISFSSYGKVFVDSDSTLSIYDPYGKDLKEIIIKANEWIMCSITKSSEENS